MKNASKKSPHLNLSFLPSFLRRQRASSYFSCPPPFEVAPGILSTDATAKVFGLDQQVTVTQKPRPKSLTRRKPESRPAYHQDASPTNQNIETCELCSCRASKHLPIGSKDVPNALGMGLICSCCERYSKPGGNYPQIQGRRQSAHKKGRLPRRVKDSEDHLTVKYPNPSTGIMTPSVVSDSSGDVKATPGSNLFSKARKYHDRQNGGRWRKDSHSWFNDEPTTLSTIPQSLDSIPNISFSANISNTNDRFVVKMPTAREPAPYEHPGKTSSQIEEWENKRNVDSTTASIHHRLAIPKGHRAPEVLLKEKMQDSEDTIIINSQMRAAYAPTPSKESDIPCLNPRTPVVRVLSPSSEKSSRPTQSLQVPKTKQERPKDTIISSKDGENQECGRISNHKNVQSSPRIPSRTREPGPKDDIEGGHVPPQQRSLKDYQKTSSKLQETATSPTALDEYEKALLNNVEIVKEVTPSCSAGTKDCHHRHVHHHYYLPKSGRRRRRYHSWHEKRQNHAPPSKREDQGIKAKDTISKRSLRHRTDGGVVMRHSEHMELFDQIYLPWHLHGTFNSTGGTDRSQDDAEKQSRLFHVHTHVLIPDWKENNSK